MHSTSIMYVTFRSPNLQINSISQLTFKMTSIKKTLPKCKISSVIGLYCFVLYAHTTSAANLNTIHTDSFIMNTTIAQIQRPLQIRPTIREYEAERLAVVAQERASNFESDTPELTEREQLANDIVMKFKQEDLSNGHQNPRNFAPSQYFYDVIDQIRESKLFKIIRIMPKGGILHTHDTAVASLDYLISVTYREHLWQGVDTETNEIEDFKFSRESPADLKPHLNWTLAAKERSSRGRDNYDAYIRSLFTLRNNIPRNTHRDINKVWDIFGNMFGLAEPLISFVPVWSDYYRETLREALQDNVQYMEFRGTLPTLYDLDGNNYSPSDSIQLYVDVLKDFKNENPDFIGSKFIFAPVKAVPDSVVEEYMRIVVQLHEEFPDFMAGFDLVGREADSRQLISFTERILELPTDIKLFFHAGETNWFGSVDENMVIYIAFITINNILL